MLLPMYIFMVLQFPLLICILSINLKTVFCNQKNWKYKSIKKLSKSEVEVKTYVFPCSVDEEKFLNTTFGSSHKHLHNCKRKLVIKMTVNSGGEFSSKSDGFIPIDHVTDGMTGRKKRLLNPLMIRLKREKMFQLYDLQLVQAVNAEAKEEVINYENSPNFTGCDTTSSHPTCGFSFFNNKIIQFSEGFCCSCDQTKNDQRQPCDSHSLDIKSLPEQSRYAHPHRNRSSRGLEAIEPGLELSASNSNFEEEEDENDENSLSLASQSQPFLKGVVAEEGNFAFESHLESGVLENSNDVFINDQSLLDERTDNDGPISGVISNLSVKRFQFDYSIAPKDLCSTEISEPGLSFGNEDEFQFTTSSEGGGNNFTNFLADINSTLSKEKLKLLMMNKIKLEKYEEKMESTTLCTFPENNEKYNQIRSLTSKQEGAKNITKVFPKSSPREFSLKLINRDSELNIELVTKRANNFNISSKESLLSTANYDTKTTEKSTNNSFVKFVKLLKSRPPLSQNISGIKHLKQGNKVNADNETNGIKSIENIVHKLIPIISPPFMSSEVVNYSTLQLELKNAEQITQNVTYEDQQKPTTDGFQTATTQYLRNSNNKFTSKKRLQQSLTKQNSSLDDSVQKHLSELNEPGLEIDRTRLNLEGHQSKIIEKRDVCVNDRQIRGGQSCSPVAQLPCNADPVTYYESAHCLRFSDLWYNVHRLVNPRVENSITVKIYAKHKTTDKRICWENLTKRLPGRVGTANEILTDDARTIVIWYSADDKVAYSLDCSSDYLLVPQPLPKKCKDTELKTVGCGGPGEYLVLRENEITMDGDECDRAGVNYGAFSRQTHRCQHEAGSCLKNQPLQFWRDDKKAAEEGRSGQYFLNNFISVSDQTILQNVTSGQVVLRAPYYEHYQSHIIIELKADQIDIIADRSEGQITEVYIDATSNKFTIIKVVVTNMGIAVDYFGVDFVNCTHPLGPSDFDKPSKDEIPPQHRMTYTATISTPMNHKRIECNIALYSSDQELVAQRHIIIVRGERCMCVWHCKCVCYNHPRPGLLCTPLSTKHYHQAGFVGQLPVRSGADCSTLFLVIQGLLWFFFFLLLFGMIKALLGLCISYVAVWGLWYVMPDEARCLYCYMEPHLACYPLVRDSEGYPIHPRNYTRTVHFLPWFSEFAINIFYFICFARTCLCDSISRKASCMMISDDCNHAGEIYSRHRVRPHISPGCSTRCGPSPCHTICSNRRRYRLAAGGEPQIDTDHLAMKDMDNGPYPYGPTSAAGPSAVPRSLQECKRSDDSTGADPLGPWNRHQRAVRHVYMHHH
ncbi:uncharacterized protein LOC124352942 isoform X2 [Homalodisca vitripennis]|uniref:uncharacterized protein LOC124352942 isoform X2 n=1 Tax=Homalodisca vitripennis TaxID=197043 RepID=UPI001EEC19F8|nr:uncharacterized protein LOC124352942 isoform X2 [Homalodisca vitripennis]